jgi:diguanylate cyclase (GGDEF)-like protein
MLQGSERSPAMKTSISALAVIFGCFSAAWAAGSAPLTSIQAVRALSNAQAAQGLPVAFEATATYFPGYSNLLFVQDGSAAVFVLATTNARILPGDRVLVRGTTRPSFHPIVVSNDVTVLRHGNLPKPVPATFDGLIRGQFDCMLVTVHAVVRTADLGANTTLYKIFLQMIADGGYIDATVDSEDPGVLKGLLDSEVQVTAIAGGTFDGKMQQTGILLHVPSPSGIRILKRANASPESLPITPMDEILDGYHVQDQSQRVRVRGTITYYQPGAAVVLQNGAKSLWITTLNRNPLQIGDQADATGFPESHSGSLVLTHGEIEDSHVNAPLLPQNANWRQLAFWSANRPDGHLYDLVSIEGKVMAEVSGPVRDEYVLLSDGQLFSATYRHPQSSSPVQLAPVMQVPLGSRIRVTGICMTEDVRTFNNEAELPFNILLRTPDDIALLANPTPLNPRNLLLLIGFLLAILFAVGARGYSIERKVRRQTATMAYIEQRRGQILERINSSRPLAAIIEEITELVSCKLKGAPSWCQVAGGAQLGNCPPKMTAFRVIQAEIPARSGPPLGSVFAALDPGTKPVELESDALSMASALAALAIETHRLYSDLLHRSEFDQLTNVQNRFSMDKHLDNLIAGARDTAGLFGLVYVDLDGFKQINDLYGHQVGDKYLQEVALRMKRQLRSVDMLARVGGDEFAVLLPAVRSRADVEEVAIRLEECFEVAFGFERITLRGSASLGIAVYPQDATSKELLFRVADAEMYAAKNLRHRLEISLADGLVPEPSQTSTT